MGKIKETLKLAVETLVPGRYPDLSERYTKTAVLYLAKILCISICIMAVAGLPLLAMLPSTLDQHFAKFTKLKLGGQVEMTAPVRLPEKNTQIIIDTTGNTTSMTTEKLVITKDSLNYKPFFSTQSIDLSNLGDVVGNKWFFKSLIIIMTILVLPGVLLLLYIVLLVKYLLTALIAGAIVFVIFDLTKFKLPFRKMFKTACYATTPMILLEVAPLLYGINYLIPMFRLFGINFYLVPLIVYLALFFTAVITIQWRYDRRFDEGKKAYVKNGSRI